MSDRPIYLDNAATTPMSPAVLNAIQEVITTVYGNASSIHSAGREARKQVEKSRRQAAAALNAQPQEIYFTGGGSESDNWAIKGAAFARQKQGRHIITTQIEHHAVLHTCDWLKSQGFEVTLLPVTAGGYVRTEDLERAIRPDTILVSVMLANNEIGTIQPVA